MKDYPSDKLDKLVEKARQQLSDSQALIKDVAHEATDFKLSDESTTIEALLIELILQYRMDSQNALAKLLQIDQSLLQILGITSLNSVKTNLERMQFALGNDDLQYILHALSQLVHSLLQIARLQQQKTVKTAIQKQTLHHRPSKATTHALKCYETLKKAVVAQKLFVSSLTNIDAYLDEWDRLAAGWPVLDHISGFRNSVAQFFEAIQHDLELSKSIYETTNLTFRLDHKLDDILEQAASILKQMPSIYPPNHFFSHDNTNTADRLEERASIRRLGHFFNH